MADITARTECPLSRTIITTETICLEWTLFVKQDKSCGMNYYSNYSRQQQKTHTNELVTRVTRTTIHINKNKLWENKFNDNLLVCPFWLFEVMFYRFWHTLFVHVTYILPIYLYIPLIGKTSLYIYSNDDNELITEHLR